MPIQIVQYQLRFASPAFLGNANQQAQWRTPPIKALLRQWWRVAYAANRQFAVRVDEMRDAEGLLFGHAWLENDQDRQGNKTAARKSQVRLRLGHWNPGSLKSWAPLRTVFHPEVRRCVGSDLYMGYGPLTLPQGAKEPGLKAPPAIQDGETTDLAIAFPEAHASLLRTALHLMDRYGTLGGRSRNGWGSFSLSPAGNDTPAFPAELDASLVQPLDKALKRDWPHAIGSDRSGALIWQTDAFDDWKTLMQELARIKIGLRTQSDFSFPQARPDGQVHNRHWLSYPVTNHSVKHWGGNARLPNSLRFKVRPAPGDAQKVVGVIFHVPCQPPPAFNPDHATLMGIWQKVHKFLDDSAQKLTRIPA